MMVFIMTVYPGLLPAGKNSMVYGAGETRQQYTCGMHPQIVADEPGYCPVCGMKLTPKKNGSGRTGMVTIDPVTVRNMGLKTVPVQNRTIVKSVRAFGEVTFRQPNINIVSVKFSGWAERLLVDYEGARVSRGQPMLEIYSPELVAAQKEILIARKASESAGTVGDSDNMKEFLSAARKKLYNWDISDDQIDKLLEDGEISRTMVIRAPADGVVLHKNVIEGEQVKPGQKLYEIADISSVWVSALVYEQDLPWVNTGQPATVLVPSLPGKEFSATVSYVSPYLDERRQAEIRLEMNNPGNTLVPMTYAEVTFHSQLPGLVPAIPRSAIIHSGVRQTVFVSRGDGAYEPRVVTTGTVGDDDYVRVLSGLELGEQVVVSGQFLLDSESRLSESLTDAPPHQGDMTSMTSSKNKYPVPVAGEEGHEHNRTDKKEEFQFTGIYTCPMPEHFHVLQYGEGECSDCGMALVPVEETDNTGFYHCPMSQCRVVQAEPGCCSVCGMELVRYEKAVSNDK